MFNIFLFKINFKIIRNLLVYSQEHNKMSEWFYLELPHFLDSTYDLVTLNIIKLSCCRIYFIQQILKN